MGFECDPRRTPDAGRPTPRSAKVGNVEIAIDRISPITMLLDEVFYKSTIQDMRARYLPGVAEFQRWCLLSDYCLEGNRANKTITFTALPLTGDLDDLRGIIGGVAPNDLKRSRTIDRRFITLLHALPLLNFTFVFEPDKYLAWENRSEFRDHLADYFEVLTAYVDYWRKTTLNQVRLDKLEANIVYAQKLLREKKKTWLLCQMFMIGLLGGYVGSLLCRETALTDLCWLSDRDSTNELGENLIRDIFQVTLIDVAKKNIQFSFTSANSDSDEWYTELTRIPDVLAGSIAGFDFANSRNHTFKPAAQIIISDFVYKNHRNCFIYRFLVADDGMKVQRLLVSDATKPCG